MERWDDEEDIELVAKRSDFLSALDKDVHQKPSLVDTLDTSRSTVDRVISDLEAAGFVERTAQGWTTTTLGRLLNERYRAFVRDEHAVLDAADALATLPSDAEIPSEMIVDGDIVPAQGEPVQLYERLFDAIRNADSVDMLFSQIRDSRLLRLCHARALNGEFTGGLIAPQTVLNWFQREFPELAADFGTTRSFDIRVGDPPEFELVVVRKGDVQRVYIVLGESEPVALVYGTEDSVVEWANGVFASVGADTERAMFPTEGERNEDITSVGIEPDERLRDQGFERVDSGYFTGRTPAEPETAWQTGHDLVDVYYGLAAERRVSGDESDESIANAVIKQLHDAEGVAVIGPPGAGKSITCRRISCQWITSGRGPVFYRRGGVQETFDAPGRIASLISNSDGEPLVVVDDAGDCVDAILEFIRELPPDIPVVLGARTERWRELEQTVSDPRLHEMLRSDVTEYHLPPVNVNTCRRAIDAFESTTGRDVALDAPALAERIDDGSSGGMYLLSYHLVAHSGFPPWRRGERAPTGLQGDVRETFDALDSASNRDLALAVGSAFAALIAANRPVSHSRAYAIAASRVVGNQSDAPAVETYRHVEDTLDILEGRLVFENDEADAYRTQHPYWAVQFLETALEQDKRRTIAAFRRGVGALLSSSAPERHNEIGRWLDDPGKTLDVDPDDLAEALFDLPTEHSSLVPLFGDGIDDGIGLDSCRTETRLSCLRDCTLGWYEYGDLDRAEAVSRTLAEYARQADIEQHVRDRFVARSLLDRGELAEERGETDDAQKMFEKALNSATEAGDDRTEVMARNSLAWLAMGTDRFDEAQRHLDIALDVDEEHPPTQMSGTTRYYRAMLARRRGELETAERWLQRTLDIDRELGDDGGRATTLNELGIVAEQRGALEQAEEYYRRCIELRRETGNRTAMAKNVFNLGDLLAKRGRLDAATENFEQAETIAEETGMERFRGNVHGGFGRVALARGNLDEAAEHYQANREIHQEHDYEAGAAQALGKIGDVTRERGDIEVALERYERAAETLADIGMTRKAIEILERAAEMLREADRPGAAERRLTHACDLAAAAGLDDRRDHLESERNELVELD